MILDKGGFIVSNYKNAYTIDENYQAEVDFRLGTSRILVRTDTPSSHFIHQTSLILNYDLPSSNQSYLTRIGKSGKFGRKGVCINFVTLQEMHLIK